jgi:hypothetical protein
MNINVVTGFGQRTGTSFVMQKAKEKGLPIIGEKFITGLTVEKHNPNGYWDIDPFKLTNLLSNSKLNNSICKLWFNCLQYINKDYINHIVVIERQNKVKQFESMYKVLQDELTLPLCRTFYNNETVEEIYTNTTNGLIDWLNQINKDKIFWVYTEELNEKIDDVLNFLERGLKWQ